MIVGEGEIEDLVEGSSREYEIRDGLIGFVF